MFRTNKVDRKSGQRPRNDLSQLGIFGIPDVDSNIDMGSDDEDDTGLENELLSLVSGSSKAPTKRKQAKVMPVNNLDAMVAESLRDDPPSDESLSGGEDDPVLLAELNEVTGEVKSTQPLQQVENVSKTSDIQTILLERIEMYKEAEANAKSVGDAAKTRRLGRGLKTLNDLLKKAQRGGVIDESEIPMPVAKSASKPPPSPSIPAATSVEPVSSKIEDQPSPSGTYSLRPAPPIPSREQPSVDIKDPGIPGPSKENSDNNKGKTLAILATRRDEYKKAAVIAKRAGDVEKALGYVKLIKQFEAVIAGVEAGHPIDLSTMPPPPDLNEPVNSNANPPPVPPRQKDNENQVLSGQPQPQIVVQEEKPNEEENAQAQGPLTVLDALEQRMAKFLEQVETAKRDGNASKVRRMGRIVKQYEDAIKLHKAGKPFPVDELPTPPGFPPIPVEGSSANAGSVPSPAVSSSKPPPSPVLSPKHLVPEASLKPSPAPSPTTSPSRSPVPSRRSDPNVSQAMGGTSRIDKQLASLLARQKQLKEAAINAKRNGDIVKAKEFLRQAKGLDPLIEAANSGIRVDMSSIPVAPEVKESLDSEFDIVMLSDCLTGTDSEMYDQLISDLQTQFKLCMETRNHFKAIGEIGGANRFEQLAVNTKKDLDTVRVSKSRSDPIPKFHYEKRKFSIVRCNVDLSDNDLELSIIQGINYNVPNPKEVDTYVRYEFPFPNDEIKRDKTAVIYNTNNPTYGAVFTIPIQRSVRSFQRIFKRHAIKFEVWSRGYILSSLCGLCCGSTNQMMSGFLRSDTLIGTATVKLQPLETKCSIHDSFDLLEGRKVVGGKLEIKIRLRNPIQTKQVEQVEEKWLVID